MKKTHNIKVGDKVKAADGFNPDGTPRPHIIGKVAELYGPNQWPRVDFGRGHLETCTPQSLTILV